MSQGALLDQLFAAGIRLGADGDRLYADVLPGVDLSKYEDDIQKHKQPLIAELQLRERARARDDSEVMWRVTTMRAQLPPSGPIPMLMARDVDASTTCCISCGDPVSAQCRYRCEPCAQAAAIVLCETRE